MLKAGSGYRQPEAGREVGIVLLVGCGKSGLIAITPFTCQSPPTWSQAPAVSPPSWSHPIATVMVPPAGWVMGQSPPSWSHPIAGVMEPLQPDFG